MCIAWIFQKCFPSKHRQTSEEQTEEIASVYNVAEVGDSYARLLHSLSNCPRPPHSLIHFDVNEAYLHLHPPSHQDTLATSSILPFSGLSPTEFTSESPSNPLNEEDYSDLPDLISDSDSDTDTDLDSNSTLLIDSAANTHNLTVYYDDFYFSSHRIQPRQ